MARTRSDVRRQYTRILGFVLAGVIGGFALATCGGEPVDDGEEPGLSEGDVEMSSQALSSAQCHKQKSTRICHYDSRKKKFVGMTVKEKDCCSHTRDPKDYVAGSDTSCTGGACVRAGSRCDSSKKCCGGSSCKDGKCQPDSMCVPQGTACVQLVTNCCNGCNCTDPLNPLRCFCQ